MTDTERRKNNVLNCGAILLSWGAFFAWFIWVPHSRFFWPGLWLTPLVCLAFQQSIAGFIHEAAHFNLIQGHRRLNELVGNCFGSFVLLYGLESFRSEHFKHHALGHYFSPEDRETWPYRATSSQTLLNGGLKDVTGITALDMFRVRNEPGTSFWMMRFMVLVHFLTVWGLLAYFGSVVYSMVFFATLLTLYPLSNRVRTLAFHVDLRAPEGALDTHVVRNIHSPGYERIFFGNRLLMYHHDHHLQPGQQFRECERRAKARLPKSGGGRDVNIQCSSYLAFLFHFIRGTFVNPGVDPNERQLKKS